VGLPFFNFIGLAFQNPGLGRFITPQKHRQSRKHQRRRAERRNRPKKMGAALAKCLEGGSKPPEDAEDDDFEPNPANPVATFTVSGGVSGTISAELFLDRVPLTASNFIDLAQSGFFNGLHFHRGAPPFEIERSEGGACFSPPLLLLCS
jgi:hypothetical protein